MPDIAEKNNNALLENIKVLIQAVFLALVIRTILFQPFSIPSSSMENTLLVGDYLFVSKFSYGYSKHSIPFSPDLFDGRIWAGEPERGDVAVFRPQNDINTDYIKRVIGLPGDRIQMINGVLHINGEAVEREVVGEYLPDDVPAASVPAIVYRETLPNGVSYNTLDIQTMTIGDNTREFMVPEGHYFMMGDNRDNSSDSRFQVGYVPLENFIGKAQIIFFSMRDGASPLALWKWPTSLRYERIFNSLAP